MVPTVGAWRHPAPRRRGAGPPVQGLLVAFLLGLTPLLVARAGWAATLEYAAPEVCPSRATVVEEIERLIGGSLGGVSGLDFELTLREEQGGRFHAVVRTVPDVAGEAPRTRELDGDTCAQATEAAIVAISLAVQAGQDEDDAPEPQPPAPLPPPARPPPPAQRAPQRPEAQGSARALDLAASLQVIADLGALPTPAPGGSVELWGTLSALRLIAFGNAYLTQEERLPDGSGGSFDLRALGLLACFVRPLGRVTVAGCGGMEAGVLGAEGFGLSRPTRETVTWLAPRLEVRPELDLGSALRAVVGIGASFPLTQQRFVLNQSRLVHKPSGVTGRVLAGVAFSFW